MGRFEEVDKLKAKLASYKPFDPSIESAINELLHIDWTYNSSAIEGNTYTREDTWYVYKTGCAAAGKTGNEFIEIRNHKNAVEFAEARIKEGKEITIPLIKQLHSILLYGIDSPAGREAGRYKSEPNVTTMPDGTVHTYVAPHLVDTEMEELLNWYSQQKDDLHPVELAAIFHYKFLRIHPFLDGNGRAARLLMNWILMGAGFTPAIIKAERKQEYLEAIYAGHKGRDLAPLILLVEREVIESLTLALDIIEGRKVFGVDDLERKLKGFDERMQSLEQGYNEVEGQIEEKRKKCISQVYNFIKMQAKKLRIENDKYNLSYDETWAKVDSWIDWLNEPESSESVLPRTQLLEKIRTIPIKRSSGSGGFSIKFYGKGPLENYISMNSLNLLVFASKYKIYVSSLVTMGDHAREEVDLLELGLDFEESDKKKVEEFFAKSLSCLMDMVEEEAEKRKRGESR